MTRIRDENTNTPELWDSLHEKEHNGGMFQQFKRFFDLGYLPQDEEFSILDIGCGSANYIHKLAPMYQKVTWGGLDFSPVVIAKNKRGNPNATFYELDIMKDNIPDVYDYIVSMHTFEHFDDPDLALQKCVEMCRKKVIICVPFGDAWGNAPEHVHKFTENDPWNNWEDINIIDSKEVFFIFNGEAE